MADGVVVAVEFRVEVNDGLVEMLEELLEDARSGELRVLHSFGVLRDGTALTSYSPTDDLWRDLAALERLRYRMLKGMDE